MTSEASRVAEVALFIDDEPQPFATYRPPAECVLDTTDLDDGPHVLRIRATDSTGATGIRTLPFIVRNGPGITVTGLRPNERVSGRVTLAVNAFSGDEPFDPVRAESSAPIPVWTWVMSALVAAWAGWYGLTEFAPPPSFAPLGAHDPVAAARAPMRDANPPHYSGQGAAAGFDYAATGPRSYAEHCAACHGGSGAGVPGAFPPLVRDAVVVAANPREHVRVILRGLHGKAILGIAYGGAMPSFASLDDATIAAIIDHERSSWGNRAPLVTPDDVRRAR